MLQYVELKIQKKKKEKGIMGSLLPRSRIIKKDYGLH